MKQHSAQSLSFLQYLRQIFRHPKAYLRTIEGRFTRIYRDNRWRDAQSKSGPGSNLPQTAAIRRELPHLLKEYNIKSMLDIPCGDFNWMKEINLPLEKYIGCDIVNEMIRENQHQYGSNVHEFQQIDLIRDELPRADAVLCRDCLVHLSFADGLSALKQIKKSNALYLFSTTFINMVNTKDIITGSWRPINLQAPPYDLPDPLKLINEECPEPEYHDKRLGIWEL